MGKGNLVDILEDLPSHPLTLAEKRKRRPNYTLNPLLDVAAQHSHEVGCLLTHATFTSHPGHTYEQRRVCRCTSARTSVLCVIRTQGETVDGVHVVSSPGILGRLQLSLSRSCFQNRCTLFILKSHLQFLPLPYLVTSAIRPPGSLDLAARHQDFIREDIQVLLCSCEVLSNCISQSNPLPAGPTVSPQHLPRAPCTVTKPASIYKMHVQDVRSFTGG